MNKSFITILLLLLFLSSCLKDEPFKKEYTGYDPVAINDDRTISTPEEEKIDRSNLEQAYRLLYRDDIIETRDSFLTVTADRFY